MVTKNYSSVNHLVKAPDDVAVSVPKETEPVPTIPREALTHEVGEPTPPSETIPYVKLTEETVTLPEELKKIGVKNTSDLKHPSYEEIKLPISDEKVVSGQRAPFTSSFRWLASLCIYILKKAHLTLKIIHGKVIRTKE